MAQASRTAPSRPCWGACGHVFFLSLQTRRAWRRQAGQRQAAGEPAHAGRPACARIPDLVHGRVRAAAAVGCMPALAAAQPGPGGSHHRPARGVPLCVPAHRRVRNPGIQATQSRQRLSCGSWRGSTEMCYACACCGTCRAWQRPPFNCTWQTVSISARLRVRPHELRAPACKASNRIFQM